MLSLKIFHQNSHISTTRIHLENNNLHENPTMKKTNLHIKNSHHHTKFKMVTSSKFFYFKIIPWKPRITWNTTPDQISWLTIKILPAWIWYWRHSNKLHIRVDFHKNHWLLYTWKERRITTSELVLLSRHRSTIQVQNSQMFTESS